MNALLRAPHNGCSDSVLYSAQGNVGSSFKGGACILISGII